MLLFVGLGNPGKAYAGNRHNIGFMALDEIARTANFPPFRARFQGLATEGASRSHHGTKGSCLQQAPCPRQPLPWPETAGWPAVCSAPALTRSAGARASHAGDPTCLAGTIACPSVDIASLGGLPA